MLKWGAVKLRNARLERGHCDALHKLHLYNCSHSIASCMLLGPTDGPASGYGGEAAGPSEDAGSGMLSPSNGVLWLHQLYQRYLQGGTLFLQQLVEVTKEQEKQAQA
ncbi:hypothetical protein Y1Q_0007336 [Alligator mississippiensis]|uniref:Uncharacterized protein n=1 Tax=Alligator mississippiensis TaxID=8496 RepID=A0A151P8H0_ALLMI|nr:hypothetical protein Y1Q_0007336 [Alligator mississippiensis]